MEFDKKHIKPWVVASNRRIENMTNKVVRGWDRALGRLMVGGRKANYDDLRYEFTGGPGEAMRRKHYDRSLRLLWKAQEHSPQLDFRDCSIDERKLLEMALRSLTDQEKAERKRLSMPEYKEMLDREYTRREKQAIVNVLAAIGHGEAYAWLVSAELLNEVQSTGARSALTMQVMEEAKHFVVLRELLMAFDVPVPRQSAWAYLFLEGVYKSPGLEKFFGMNVVVEGIALSLFGMMSHLPGLEVLRLFHLDESRHTALPVNYFRDFPMTAWQRHNPRARMRRLRIILPALLLLPHLEEDLGELGIEAFDFGGSALRKISLLAERAGFLLPIPFNQLLSLLNQGFNTYCTATRDEHAFTDFTCQDTTRGMEEQRVESRIFSLA